MANNRTYTPPNAVRNLYRRSSTRMRSGLLAIAGAVTIGERGQRTSGTSGQQNLQRLQRRMDLQGLSSATTTSSQTLALEFLTATGVQLAANMGENFSFQDEATDYNAIEIENPNVVDPDITNSSGQEVTLENQFSNSDDPIYELDGTISRQLSIAVSDDQNSTGNPNVSSIEDAAITGASCMVSMGSPANTTGASQFSLLNQAPE